jgi:hypothetical protein
MATWALVAAALPHVEWSVTAAPSCPTLHGDSVDGGQGQYFIYLNHQDAAFAVIQSGDH